MGVTHVEQFGGGVPEHVLEVPALQQGSPCMNDGIKQHTTHRCAAGLPNKRRGTPVDVVQRHFRQRSEVDAMLSHQNVKLAWGCVRHQSDGGQTL